MNYTKWLKIIMALSAMLITFNAYAEDIDCSLGMDCSFHFYYDRIIVHTFDSSADYKCHVVQKNNISANGSETVTNSLEVVRYGFSVQEVYLGGEGEYLGMKRSNELNVFVPSRQVNEAGDIKFWITKKTLCWIKKIADITINCVKIV